MAELPLCECGCNGRVTKLGNRFIQGHQRIGKKHSSETIRKMSKPKPEPKLCACGCGEYASPGKSFIRGHNKSNLGKKHSLKTIKRIALSTSKALKGIPHSPEHSEAVAATKRGIPLSENHKIRVSKGMEKTRRERPEIWNKANKKMRGGNDIVNHHWLYDDADLSLNAVQITRSNHTKLHILFKKLGYKIPHINMKEESV